MATVYLIHANGEIGKCYRKINKNYYCCLKITLYIIEIFKISGKCFFVWFYSDVGKVKMDAATSRTNGLAGKLFEGEFCL